MLVRSVGGYELIRTIGCGGMSTVYEAINGGGDHVALKLLHPSLAADETSRLRLRREVAVLRKVRSPYVAQVIDAEIDAVEPFVVTELIQGLTLEKDVLDNGIYTEEDLLHLGEQLEQALQAVHAVGVLHRDLKPSNVMIQAGSPILIDFGIAQVQNDARLTQQGMLALTPGYCDPRVLNGASPDEAADWWALSAVLAFAATGEPPFGEGNAAAVMARVLRETPALPDLDPQLACAFEAALARDAGRRISFHQLLAAIENPACGASWLNAPQATGASGMPVAPTIALDAAAALNPAANEPGSAQSSRLGDGERTAVYGTDGGRESWRGPDRRGSDGRGADESSSLPQMAMVELPSAPTERLPYSARMESADATAVMSPMAGAPTMVTPGGRLGAGDDAHRAAVADYPASYGGQIPAGQGEHDALRYSSGDGALYEGTPRVGIPRTGEDGTREDLFAEGIGDDVAPRWARSPRPVYTFVLLMWCAVALLGGQWPVAVLCAVAATVWILDVVGSSMQIVRERRLRAGVPRVGDSTLAIVRLPVTALGALVRTGVLAAALGGISYGILWLAAQWVARFGESSDSFGLGNGLDSGKAFETSSRTLDISPLSAAVIVAILCAIMWLFPSTRRARLGVRYIAGGAAERAGIRWLWIAGGTVAVLGAAVLFAAAVQRGSVSFSPLDSAFSFLIQ
ncbi:MAG: serine/threonine-protein kinase [Actinomycetaceae bacterium]|nr:serine/threonine protein kinase [Arcanobacterium sp.]MDD7687569.1 serine/threonine-protein kinase [Actinomycetaceae bacterium]MDY5273193.1 serine/threonine-protein kinase [Arcanobacterium sp.]